MADTKDRRLRPPKLVPIVVAACLAAALGMGVTVAVAATPQVQRGAFAQAATHHDVSPPLRAMVNSGTPGRAYPARPLPGHASAQADAARQAALGPGLAPALGLGFDGMGNGFTGFTVDSAPPDPAGAAGPTDYVQIVNEGVTVFDKSGAVVFGPVATNTFWSGFGGGCQSNNDGDGTVEYDRQANRWVISQFSVSTTPFLECIAVSQTGDPTGSYNRYAFTQPDFPDYPKVAVWPDAYYATFNMFSGNTFTGGRACALDRARMLAAQSATQQCFDTDSTYGSLLPSDVTSATLPPAGSPNYLVALGADTSSLAYWKFHIDFANSANTTFTGPTALTVDTYAEACGGDNSCIPQSGTNTVLDSLGDRLMYHLAYRNFGDHEALVVDHSVTSGSAVGVRWYELRVGTGNTLSVFQQGTFAPDSTFRWLGSAALDKNGDIALGYSTSSSSLHPGIRFTARTPSDTAGTMGQGEGTVITGAGSQTNSLTRWGDYSSLTIDPSDDCTFWYVNEYLPANGRFNWRTRIATFNVSGCPSSIPPPPAAPTGVSASSSDGSVSLTWTAVSGATGYKVFRGTSPGGENLTTPVGTPSGNSFNDTGRTNGTTYYYKVEATNGGGDSPPSSEASATPVATPTGLGATPSGTSVSLDWGDAAGATSYRVFRGTSPGGESSTPVGTPSGSSFNDTGLTAGNHYYYKVSAVNSTGSSPQSSEANALLVPPAPLNLQASPGDGHVQLTWSAANGAASYKVLRGTSSNGETQIATPTGTSFNDTGVVNGTHYFYEVKATNTTGDGPVSGEVPATPTATPPPPAPTSLGATAGNGSVSLSWSSSSGATSYRVYRGTSPSGEGPTPVGSPSGTSFTDSGLTNGTTYYYRVSAVGAGGEGAQSSEASATPQAPVQQQQPPQQQPPTTTTTTPVPPIPLPPQLILPAADTTPPTLTIAGVGKQKLSDALKKGVSVDLGCSEACTDAVTLLLDFKTAHALHLAATKKPVKVGGKSFSLSAGHRKVRVPLSSKARKRLRGAHKVTLTVQVVGSDKSGNKTTGSKRLTLR